MIAIKIATQSSPEIVRVVRKAPLLHAEPARPAGNVRGANQQAYDTNPTDNKTRGRCIAIIMAAIEKRAANAIASVTS